MRTALSHGLGPAPIVGLGLSLGGDGRLIDGIAQGSSIDDAVVLTPVLLLAGVAFLQRSFDRLMERSWELLADAVHLEVKTRFMRAITAVDVSVFEDPAWLPLKNRVG